VQHRQIHDIVAHVGDLVVFEQQFVDDLFVRLEFAVDALMKQGHAELRRPLRRRRRRTRRQKADNQPGALRQHDAGAVLDVELFALGAVGVQQDLAVGEHAVDVEEDQLDAGRLCVNQ